MLFRLLKSVSKWVYEGFQAISVAEDRIIKDMFKEKIDDERNED